MTLFALPILILLMVSAIILLAFKRWKLASSLALVVLMLNWYWQVCPLHLYSGEEPTSRTFRVVTYNIYPDADTTDMHYWQDKMMQQIRVLNPDILCFQEFDPVRLADLEDSICKYYNYTDEIKKERSYIRRRLYSRYPMYNIKRYNPVTTLDTTAFDASYYKSIKMHNIYQPFYSADVALPSGDSVTVFSCHLQSNGYSTIRRSMKQTNSWLSGIPKYYNAVTTALDIRLWEAKELRMVLDSIGNNNPVIIAGDMNDFNSSPTLRTIMGVDFYDAWWKRGCGLGLTFYGQGLMLRLDHVLYNKCLEPTNIVIGDSKLSDHRPIITDFIIIEDKIKDKQ